MNLRIFEIFYTLSNFNGSKEGYHYISDVMGYELKPHRDIIDYSILISNIFEEMALFILNQTDGQIPESIYKEIHRLYMAGNDLSKIIEYYKNKDGSVGLVHVLMVLYDAADLQIIGNGEVDSEENDVVNRCALIMWYLTDTGKCSPHDFLDFVE